MNIQSKYDSRLLGLVTLAKTLTDKFQFGTVVKPMINYKYAQDTAKVNSFFETFPNINTYSVPPTELETHILNTKQVLSFLRSYLEFIKDSYLELVDSKHDIVDIYIEVLATFAYMRYVMTVFILLQKNQISSLGTLSSDARTQIASLSSKIAALESQLQSLSSSKSADQQTIQSLTQQIFTLREEISKLQSATSAQQALTTEQKQEVDRLTGEIAKLTTSISSLSTELGVAKQQVTNAKQLLSDADQIILRLSGALKTAVGACAGAQAGVACVPDKQYKENPLLIEQDSQKILEYIRLLEGKVNSLGELIQYGVPIIAKLPSNPATGDFSF